MNRIRSTQVGIAIATAIVASIAVGQMSSANRASSAGGDDTIANSAASVSPPAQVASSPSGGVDDEAASEHSDEDGAVVQSAVDSSPLRRAVDYQTASALVPAFKMPTETRMIAAESILGESWATEISFNTEDFNGLRCIRFVDGAAAAGVCSDTAAIGIMLVQAASRGTTGETLVALAHDPSVKVGFGTACGAVTQIVEEMALTGCNLGGQFGDLHFTLDYGEVSTSTEFEVFKPVEVEGLELES